jgi:hypothetical protein
MKQQPLILKGPNVPELNDKQNSELGILAIRGIFFDWRSLLVF